MSYPAPVIPETPYQKINSVLRQQFSTSTNSIFQWCVGQAVCRFFQAVVTIYNTLNQSHQEWDAKKVWQGSCGVAAAAVGLASWLTYSFIIYFSFVFHATLYYSAVLVGFAGIGLGIAGVVYSNKSSVVSGSAGETRSSCDSTKHD